MKIYSVIIFLTLILVSSIYIINNKSTEEKVVKISSQAFENNQPIPTRYTCDGDDINPAITIDELPEGTKTVALIFDDPDAPTGTANPGWVHWVAYNILPENTEIEEYTKELGQPGLNDWGRTGYGGPCPPSGEHRYVLNFYALDASLSFDEIPSKAQLLEAMENHILDSATLTGVYTRS